MFSRNEESTLAIVGRLAMVIGIMAFGFWFAYAIVLVDGGSFTSITLSTIMILSSLMIGVIFLWPTLYPWRWFSPGLVLMSVMIFFPVIFTVYIAFTNFGTGNLLSQEQVLDQLLSRTYLPEEGGAFTWTAYQSESNEEEFLLWLMSETGDGILVAEEATLALDDVDAAPLDADGVPESIPGYVRLERAQTLRYIGQLGEIPFGDETDRAFVRTMDQAAQVVPQYAFDEQAQTLTDQETGAVYEPVDGTYTNLADEEDQLRPGYYVLIGGRNFGRLLNPNSPLFDLVPFTRIFVWTLVYSVSVVITTFALGLFLALIFNDPTLPGRKLIQSMLIIPYAIPAFISVQVWKGLINPQFGIVSQWLAVILGEGNVPSWFNDPFWAKVGIILVNLWLGFPYMFLVATGALQAIPQNVYEAADIDGANSWQRFRRITLPLLLVAMGPLLIGSFAFNFNNFTVIDVYNEGKPPMAESSTVAGHTDILLTYIVRVAFTGGRGTDFGYASAITILIFFILGAIVAYQFRYTRVWEEISENV